MTVIASTVFIASFTLLCYAWIVYPLFMTTRRPKIPTEKSTGIHDSTPPVAILVSAHNEAEVIAARIANIIALDYPQDRIHVWIGCDGCTDNTVAIASEAATKTTWIHVIAYPQNRGKVSVLRDLVSEAQDAYDKQTPPILVFTDANTHFRTDAIRQLVRHFEDPAIGGVCGQLIFTGTGSHSEQSYWNLENRLKLRESDLDSCLGANGAIYALRTECFWSAVPVNTIVDDFVLGMKVREAGLRMHYEPAAIAEEDVPAVKDEWRRRVRIGSGDYQAAWLCRACLHPRFGSFAWCFWSHKILRWFSPHLILILIVTASLQLAFSGNDHYASLLDRAALVTVSGYALLVIAALAGHLARQLKLNGQVWQLCGGIEHWVTMQIALWVGFVRYCRGNLSGTWTRTPRTDK
jgi:cellulose synthase/poly-beta-1,6-N-acetylglucosamine synthase-like glycosyltransferase